MSQESPSAETAGQPTEPPPAAASPVFDEQQLATIASEERHAGWTIGIWLTLLFSYTIIAGILVALRTWAAIGR